MAQSIMVLCAAAVVGYSRGIVIEPCTDDKNAMQHAHDVVMLLMQGSLLAWPRHGGDCS
jgi:hypothetical protein